VITLAIDASTYLGTVAVLRDAHVLADAEAAMRGREAEALMPAVASVFRKASVQPPELDRVICGAGPGSFTSLRIAASIAKGLAFGHGCPLFSVSSLALILAADGLPRPGRWLTALDALRGELYVEAFAVGEQGDVDVMPIPQIVARDDLAALAESLGAELMGPGLRFDRSPHARGVWALEPMIVPADLASWEPSYGRKAEAEARWVSAHGRPLPSVGSDQ
jgi:tRNA threonylcarbamoyladenosine biosynthesis protein TsaB